MDLLLLSCVLAGLLMNQVQYAQSYSDPTYTPPSDEYSYFLWVTSEWSKCEYSGLLPITCCECFRIRNVSCVFRIESYSSDVSKDVMQLRNLTSQNFHPLGPIVPPFYCAKYAGERPLFTEPCSPCERDCVMSSWEPWSPCARDCAPSARFRIRRMLLPSLRGIECGPLSEFDSCRHLPGCPDTALTPPEFQWRQSAWTSCRKRGSDCGRGIRQRKVDCVNSTMDAVPDIFCEHHLAGPSRPSDTEACPAPCDCQVSEWEAWSACSVSCHRGNGTNARQERQRHVETLESNGGRGCPQLEETRRCPLEVLPPCPRYLWHSNAWGRCELGADDSVSACGPGVQKRQVKCVQDTDLTGTQVHHVLCTQDALLWHDVSRLLRPERKRACQIACPRDCQLGEWENWSSCTKSCGPDGVRIRTKPILVEPSQSGVPCGDRYETSECAPVPCIWWYAGRWSACLMDSSSDSCGIGQSVKSVFCLSSLDDVLPDANCTELGPKPSGQRKCRLPCADECKISDWSDWGPCSVTCGAQGGLQHRTRYIVSAAPGGEDCLGPDELSQSRVCNQGACRDFLWQVSAWSSCQPPGGRTSRECRNGTGIRTRQVLCQRDPGYMASESMCDAASRPASREQCTVPCDQPCKLGQWQAWSDCSQPCGPESLRTRVRRVMVWPMNGGDACHEDTQADGTIRQTKRCRRVPPCETNAWEIGEWGACESEAGCGYGVSSRQMTCLKIHNTRNLTVSEMSCAGGMLGPLPQVEKACFLPCEGDCALSDWSEFSECPDTCEGQPSYTQRTRSLLFPDPAMTLFEQCPHLLPSNMTESRSCPNVTCYTYNWSVGPWTSCVMPISAGDKSKIPCGPGVQRRHVLCMRSDGIAVDDYRCEGMVSMPRRHRTCAVDCPIACEVATWAEWGECDAVCGMGIKTRYREAQMPSVNGGASCPHLEEQDTCTSRSCLELEWNLSPWSRCLPYNDMPCGRGRQTREVVCPAGPELESECSTHKTRPSTVMECDEPCLGDCRLSTWSDWFPCSCEGGRSWQERSREITDIPYTSGKPCDPLVEFRECVCEEYELEFGDWGSCMLDDPASECGGGHQSRPINCQRQDGVRVSISLCEDPVESLTKPCHISCPTHCILGDLESWSPCSADCGSRSFKTRGQSILTRGNELGLQCPRPETLIQNTTCHTRPCFTYTWSRGPWSPCQLATRAPDGCGLGVKHRDVICLRNDGEAVEPSHCIMAENGSHAMLQELSDDLRRDLDLHMEEQCGSPCPGDCLVSEWSPFGPCFLDCTDILQSLALQVRSRVILKQAEPTGSPCPSNLHDVRRCELGLAFCPSFSWEPGKWNNNHRRKVHCVSHDGEHVTGGCLKADKPSVIRHCRPLCGSFAYCDEGTCRCNQGYVGDGYICDPEFGCQTEDHCIFGHTYCDIVTKSCICSNGMALSRDFICPAPRVSLRFGQTPLGLLFLYILLGSACALVGVTACLVAFVFRKRRKKNHGSNPPNAQPGTPESSLNKIDNVGTERKEINTDPKELPGITVIPPPRPPKNVNIHVPSPAPTPPSTQERQPKQPDKVKANFIFGKPKPHDRKVNFEDEQPLPAIPKRPKNRGVDTTGSGYDSPNRNSPVMQRSLYENTTPPPLISPLSEPLIYTESPQPLYTKAYPRGNYRPYHLPWQQKDPDNHSGDSEEYDHPPPIAPRPLHTKTPSPLMPPTKDGEVDTPSVSTDSQRSTSPKPRKQTRFADTPTDIPEKNTEPHPVAAEILHDDRPPGVPYDAFSYIIPQSNQPIRSSPTPATKPQKDDNMKPVLPVKQSRDQPMPPKAFSYIVPPPPPEEDYESRSSHAYDDEDEYEEYDSEVPAEIPPIPPARTPKPGESYYDHPMGAVPYHPQYPDTYIPLSKGYKPKHEIANMIPAQQPMRGVITRRPQKAVKIETPEMASPRPGRRVRGEQGGLNHSRQGMPSRGQSSRDTKTVGAVGDDHKNAGLHDTKPFGKSDDRKHSAASIGDKGGFRMDGHSSGSSQGANSLGGQLGTAGFGMSYLEPPPGGQRGASFDDTSSGASFGTTHASYGSGLSGLSSASSQMKTPMHHKPQSPLPQRSMSPRSQPYEQMRSPIVSTRANLPSGHPMSDTLHNQHPPTASSMNQGYGTSPSSESSHEGPPSLEPRSHLYSNQRPGQRSPLLEPRSHTYQNHSHGQPSAKSPLMPHRHLPNPAPRSLPPAAQGSGHHKHHKPQAPAVASLAGGDSARPYQQSPPTPPPILNYDNLRGLQNGGDFRPEKPRLPSPTKVAPRSASPKKSAPPTAPKPANMRTKPPIGPSKPKDKQERLSAAESEELDQLIEELQSMGQ